MRIHEIICSACSDNGPLIEDAAEAKILERVLEMLKPIKCSNCLKLFSDLSSIKKHVLLSHTNSRITIPNVLVPK